MYKEQFNNIISKNNKLLTNIESSTNENELLTNIESQSIKLKNIELPSNESYTKENIKQTFNENFINDIFMFYLTRLIGYLYFLCFSLIIYIILTGVLITYVIFVTIGLVIWIIKDQHQLCPSSNIYYYGYLSTIFFIIGVIYIIFVLLVFTTEYDNNDEIKSKIIKIIHFTFHLISNIIFIVWGVEEFYNNSCVNILSDTLLYKCSYVYFIYLIINSFITIGYMIYLQLNCKYAK